MAPTLLTLRCRKGCHLASCGLNAARQVVIVGTRTVVRTEHPQYPVSADLHRGQVYVVADVPAVLADDDVFLNIGCRHHQLSAGADELRAWTAEAAGGGRKVRIIKPVVRARDMPWPRRVIAKNSAESAAMKTLADLDLFVAAVIAGNSAETTAMTACLPLRYGMHDVA